MREHEGPRFFERFDQLQQAQAEFERHGFVFAPVPREHTEGLVTGPLLHRVRTDINKRSFARVAGHTAITFSGYGEDPRELFEIPEVRAYWQTLDSQLSELPALLTALPAFNYNGPSTQLMLLGTIDAVIRDPAERRYHVHVVEGPALIADAIARIRQAGRKYHLPSHTTDNLIEHFKENAGAE